jgi:putative DNA primase/helicase
MAPSTDHASLDALDELMLYPQWVVWRYKKRGTGKPTKVPYDPKTGRKAKVSSSSTWGTYAVAEAAFEKHNYDGVGFVFTEGDPFAGIDLDKCRDPETGAIENWAQALIDKINSYTEISPSGSGVKIFLKGNVVKGGRRTGPIEMYSSGRYFTVTGAHLANTPGH